MKRRRVVTITAIIQWAGEHSLVLLLAAGTVFSYYWLLKFKKELSIRCPAAALCAVLHTVFGVLSVMIFAIVESGFNISAFGNMSLFGGVFFMPMVYYGAAKLFYRKTGDVFDVCTICMLFTLMCARINCIISGCCQGNVIPGTALRWPTREAEVVFYIILLIILGRKVIINGANGMIYPLYMIAYGAFRFISEFFRSSQQQTGIFHIAHVWAIIAFALGLSIYYEIQRKKKKVRR